MLDTPAYAHTLEGQPSEGWEPLERHLKEVADLAGKFASAFGSEDWARLAGLWHDLGKYSADSRLMGNAFPISKSVFQWTQP